MNEFEEELQRVLVATRPVIDWSAALPAAGLIGPDVWHREDPDLWPMSDPPEAMPATTAAAHNASTTATG